MSAPDLSEVEHPSYDRLPPWEIKEMHSPFQVPNVEEMKCPQCGRNFKGLGCHFRDRPEHRPALTEKQRDLVTGLLMGDGWLQRDENNPILGVGMVTAPYLQHLDRAFGPLATGVRLMKTATESARENRDSGFRPDAEASNYQDVYCLRTRRLPELAEFSSWYESGKKVWPSDIELSPTVLRTLYVADGSWANHGSNDRIVISMANEREHTEKITQYFERADLPTPSNYATSEFGGGYVGCSAEFTVEDSRELFEYMAPAPPGFSRKFPDEYC